MTAEIRKGRVYDAGTGRWYRDGYAPFQLDRPIAAWCGRCNRESLTITSRGAWCVFCSPGLVRAD